MNVPDTVVTGRAAALAADDSLVQGEGFWLGIRRRLLRDRLTLCCAAVLALMLLAILSAPWLAPGDPYQGSMLQRLRPIGTPGHLLGTDELGRDMLTRLLYGGRLSWLLGITPVLIAMVVGGALGIVAGFAGGWLNMVIMRTTDVFYAFPSVLLAVAISGALGPGIGNAILSLCLVFVPQIIRVAETATTAVRNLDYVESARANGASAWANIWHQILPNVLGTIFTYSTSLVSVSMVLASGLSFLGLGSRPPDAEWGLMLNTLRTAVYLQPMIALLPGLCIFVTSVCFNLLSEGLRSAMELKR
ncbi:ABC transporter permease [Chitinasiproducens palmae]|uniref:Peptide/nickel transport system permease protein n=1 Tax=Chitinasiproducens palmae TaxID=1770053 RepID=A0A1H2PVD2_9BURK|nr:ABC transporter permease [Chitinasiproducens palmae]SDV50799.1 peptide/nickel transport system permease protein [Chitinasiproducens palmae]